MKLSVVPCPPVVEVLVKRPDVKYQLGFSVQNGVVCVILITCLFSVLCTKSIRYKWPDCKILAGVYCTE